MTVTGYADCSEKRRVTEELKRIVQEISNIHTREVEALQRLRSHIAEHGC